MKASKFMAIVMMACTILAVGCKKSGGNEEPEIKKTTPDVAATEGAVTVVWQIANLNELCDEIGFVFAGNYNNWNTTDVDAMAHFKKIEGYDDWFMVVIPLVEGVDHLEGKPCALQKDGTFESSWANQWIGTEEHPCEIIGGSAELQTEYEVESKLVCAPEADVVYVKSYAFKTNPCVDAVFDQVTFNLTVEVPVKDGGTVYIVGDAFEKSWDQTAYPMTGSGSNWTITLPAIVGKEYKFCVNADWANDQMILDTEKDCIVKAGNMKVDFTTMEPNVYGFMNFGVDSSMLCKEEVVEGVMYIKCAGNGWTWTQMTVDPDDNTKFTYETTATDVNNIGANIGVSDAADGQWYPLEAGEIAEGDAIVYTFVSTEGATGTLTVAKK